MVRNNFSLVGIAAALAFLLLAPCAIAHHSYAMFDQTKVVYQSGTLKELEFVNPHVWLHVAISGDKGVATWSFEGGSPTQLVRLGWSKDAFKSGDMVEVGYRPMKDGSRGGQIMSIKLGNGQKVCSNRGCGDGTGGVVIND